MKKTVILGMLFLLLSVLLHYAEAQNLTSDDNQSEEISTPLNVHDGSAVHPSDVDNVFSTNNVEPVNPAIESPEPIQREAGQKQGQTPKNLTLPPIVKLDRDKAMRQFTQDRLREAQKRANEQNQRTREKTKQIKPVIRVIVFAGIFLVTLLFSKLFSKKEKK